MGEKRDWLQRVSDYEGSETFFLRYGKDRFLLAFFVRDEAWKKGEIYSEKLDNLTMFYQNLLHFFHALHHELQIPFTLHDPRNHLSRFDLTELLDLLNSRFIVTRWAGLPQVE